MEEYEQKTLPTDPIVGMNLLGDPSTLGDSSQNLQTPPATAVTEAMEAGGRDRVRFWICRMLEVVDNGLVSLMGELLLSPRLLTPMEIFLPMTPITSLSPLLLLLPVLRLNFFNPSFLLLSLFKDGDLPLLLLLLLLLECCLEGVWLLLLLIAVWLPFPMLCLVECVLDGLQLTVTVLPLDFDLDVGADDDPDVCLVDAEEFLVFDDDRDSLLLFVVAVMEMPWWRLVMEIVFAVVLVADAAVAAAVVAAEDIAGNLVIVTSGVWQQILLAVLLLGTEGEAGAGERAGRGEGAF